MELKRQGIKHALMDIANEAIQNEEQEYIKVVISKQEDGSIKLTEIDTRMEGQYRDGEVVVYVSDLIDTDDETGSDYVDESEIDKIVEELNGMRKIHLITYEEIDSSHDKGVICASSKPVPYLIEKDNGARHSVKAWLSLQGFKEDEAEEVVDALAEVGSVQTDEYDIKTETIYLCE